MTVVTFDIESELPIHIGLACNDRQGNLAAHVDAIHVQGVELIEIHGHDNPLPFALDDPGWFTLDDHAYPFSHHHKWDGSMAWDTFEMTHDSAVALLEQARRSGWQCIAAESAFYEAWHADVPLDDALYAACVE
jgi:hypothetical protein